MVATKNDDNFTRIDDFTGVMQVPNGLLFRSVVQSEKRSGVATSFQFVKCESIDASNFISMCENT